MDFYTAVEPHITLANAAAWQAENDKFLWIEYNILDAINLRTNTARVDYIEERFEALLRGE